MAFTRKMLKALGIEEDKVEQIMDAHTEVTEALKAQRDDYEEKAKRLDEVEKELNGIKKDGWKDKYEKEHSDFENYKSTVKAESDKKAKAEAFKALLKEANISDTNNRYEAIAKITDLDKIEIKDGEIKDKDKLLETLKSDYAGFIVEEKRNGTKTENPPKTGGGKSEKSEIFKKDEHGKYVHSTEERQKMIAENLK